MGALLGILGGPLVEIFKTVIDRVVPDKAAAEKAKMDMLVALQGQEFQTQLEQIKVNVAEAQSGSAYAAGWRPTIGYICAASLAYNFIGYPLLTWYVAASGAGFTPPPLFDDQLLTLVFGMLGLGSLRTFEKAKRVAS